MSYTDLKKIADALYRPILYLEDVFPYERRRAWESRLTFILLLCVAIAIIGNVFIKFPLFSSVPVIAHLGLMAHTALGLALILLPARATLGMLSAFHRSYYFRGLHHLLAESHNSGDVPVSFEIAAIMHYTPEDDVTGGFLTSPYGQDVMLRLGISDDTLTHFLSSGRKKIATREMFFEREPGGVVLPVYVRSIVKLDTSFSDFLQEQAITHEHVVGSAQWVMRANRIQRERERWYSRDSLGRIEGLGKDIAFGERYTLEKYGHYIEQDPAFSATAGRAAPLGGEVEKIEAELVRTRQANVLLVGNERASRLEILALLAHAIHDGRVLPPLEYKHLFLFDIETLIAQKKTKVEVEAELVRAFTQAQEAGNIIVVLDDIAVALASASALGIDVPHILEPFFDAPDINIIATATEEQLHHTIERDSRLAQNFEVVRVSALDEHLLIAMLEQRAQELEHVYHPIMTYGAILEMVRGARRYFSEASMPDAAFDLMEQVFVRAQSEAQELVSAEIVDAVISGKTGVPLGAVQDEEQEKLLNLEEELNKRVIGQTQALRALAGALRRARAGINDPDRPIGTFLFIGPTGVGKTETAKALAELFFGDARAMHRFDMSEYQTPEAIDRLIGASDGTPGRLVSLLKEAPYHVVLLDEFEKASPQVHDLFLQILDEGEFNDALGHRVNARNTIIIATSNAGADLLYSALEAGKDVAGMEDEIVDTIVSRGTFRPELLNRFDDIILFHPLAKHEAHSIAEIALNELVERLKEKGLTLTVTDELIAYVTEKGFDPRFGGRNINRVIKETVEQAIADKIIGGEVKKGDTIVLGKADLP